MKQREVELVPRSLGRTDDLEPVPGLATVEEAVAAIAAGRMVVVIDSPDRENEGDLVMAADCVTPEAINFMATQGRGLICVSLPRERLLALQIPEMVADSSDPLRTAFHVSVDHRTRTSTGISARDRAATIMALVDPAARPDDFSRPGHMFPLASREGGVLTRAGHTEASVDLATLAGRTPAGVVCEIAAPDGEMARRPLLMRFAAQHRLPVISISALIAYRKKQLCPVTRTGEAPVPLKAATFRAVSYRNEKSGDKHIALLYGDLLRRTAPLIRVHSECTASGGPGARRCDCGEWLGRSLRRIVTEGAGALIYLRGRAPGHPADACDYTDAAQILGDLEVTRIRLLTDNPVQQAELNELGITVTERVPIQVARHPGPRPLR